MIAGKHTKYKEMYNARPISFPEPAILGKETNCSGIIRFREESDWPLKWMRSSILARIPGFRQRIIPEPSFPSQGSQARGTRLNARRDSFSYPEPYLRAVRRGALAKSKTGNHKNMVKDIYVNRTITFVVANQMPVWYGFGQSPSSRSVDRA